MTTGFQALFERQSPSDRTRTASLSDGWFAMSPRWHPNKQMRRRSHGHWFTLESSQGKVLRVLRYSPLLHATLEPPTGDLVIDWAGWMQLTGYAEDYREPIQVSIRPASYVEKMGAWRTHPDPTYRLAALLGFVSVVLGIVSVVVAVVPLL